MPNPRLSSLALLEHSSIVFPTITVAAFVPQHDVIIPADRLQPDVVENVDDAGHALEVQLHAADGVVTELERTGTRRAQVRLRAANDLQLTFVGTIELRRRQKVFAPQPFDIFWRQRSIDRRAIEIVEIALGVARRAEQ